MLSKRNVSLIDSANKYLPRELEITPLRNSPTLDSSRRAVRYFWEFPNHASLSQGNTQT